MLKRSHFEAIVVGLGCAGSATLYHLAKNGCRVLGIEAQSQIAHNKGSSHGESRIIRLVYQEHPSYTPLLHRAYHLWQHVTRQAHLASILQPHEQIFTTTGCLNASNTTTTTTGVPEAAHSCYHGALASAHRHALAHENLTAAEINHKFPAFFSFPSSFKAVMDPTGGILRPEKAIETFVQLAISHGARVATSSKVKKWMVVGDEDAQQLIHVELNNGRVFTADKLVITGGAWMAEMVPQLKPVLEIERQVVGWFDTTTSVKSATNLTSKVNDMPVFLIDDEFGNYYYGIPPDEEGLVKIGKYGHLGQTVNTVDQIDRTIHPEDEAALRRCLQLYLPLLGSAPLRKASVCSFTNTPDGHFILDAHPRHSGRVILGSACSGHGFKFAPVLGEILGGLCMNGSTEHNIEKHRLDASRGAAFQHSLDLFSS